MSTIEWTEKTWNPVTGCDRISPGCDHCYALTLAKRLQAMGQAAYAKDGDPRTSGPGFGLTMHPDRLAIPARRRTPTVWFVNSMSDLFHRDVTPEFIGRVFNVMGQAEQHTFQVLTKRPKRMARVLAAYYDTTGQDPFPNVWLGTSIESRDYNWRADHLRAAPAAVRFISAEPLLGPLVPHVWNVHRNRHGWNLAAGPAVVNDDRGLDLCDIDWLIVGGESGKDHRPVKAEWVHDLRFAAERADTAFFFKQWGGARPKSNGRELDGRTWDEMPDPALPTERKQGP